VSGWGDYGECSKTCGGGKKTRTRTVTQEKKNSGAACPALSEEADCNTQDCPPPKDLWEGSCNGHKYDYQKKLWTPEMYKTMIANGGSVGYGPPSKAEYCKYGQQGLVDGRVAGWATVDNCCAPPPPPPPPPPPVRSSGGGSAACSIM
jgi:hypothetical protein